MYFTHKHKRPPSLSNAELEIQNYKESLALESDYFGII